LESTRHAQVHYTAPGYARGGVGGGRGRAAHASGHAFAEGGTHAELYDHHAGVWRRAGRMTAGRYAHGAALLATGKVLVMGGDHMSSIDVLASAELYDPARGMWAKTGSMHAARERLTATALRDGTILVAGALASTPSTSACTTLDRACGHYSDAELYDWRTGTWRVTGRMRVSRVEHTATLLSDGTVLITGGSGSGCSSTSLASCDALTDAEIYNPGEGSWSLAGRLHTGRSSATAALLPNGTVLVAGGVGQVAPIASAEAYIMRVGQ